MTQFRKGDIVRWVVDSSNHHYGWLPKSVGFVESLDDRKHSIVVRFPFWTGGWSERGGEGECWGFEQGDPPLELVERAGDK